MKCTGCTLICSRRYKNRKKCPVFWVQKPGKPKCTRSAMLIWNSFTEFKRNKVELVSHDSDFRCVPDLVRPPGVHAAYYGVRETVVHPSEIDDDDGQDEQSIWWGAHEWPDVDQHKRPPLEDEDDDKDHHHSCRVLVPVSIRIRGGSWPPQLDQDSTIRHCNRSKHEDLCYGWNLSVYFPSPSSQVNETPGYQTNDILKPCMTYNRWSNLNTGQIKWHSF